MNISILIITKEAEKGGNLDLGTKEITRFDGFLLPLSACTHVWSVVKPLAHKFVQNLSLKRLLDETITTVLKLIILITLPEREDCKARGSVLGDE